MAFLAALPFLVLLAAPLALLTINRFRPEFRSSWLLSGAMALIALLVLVYLRVRLPLSFTLNNWIIDVGRTGAGALWQFDSLSLPFAIALLAVCVAAIAVGVQRAVIESWTYWLPGLGIAAISLLAVMAANPLALALSWTLLDGLVLIMGLLWLRDRAGADFVLHRLGLAILSTVLLTGGALASGNAVQPEFNNTNQLSQLLFLLAAGLRLGALPFNPTLTSLLDLQHVRWVLLRILPAAASLALLARLDLSGLAQSGLLLGLVWLGGLYAAAMCLQNQEAIGGLPYWLAGMGSLSVAAAIFGVPQAAQAAGLAWMLAGSLLALASVHGRTRWPLVIAGVLSLGVLPFTPSFGLLALFSNPSQTEAYAFLLPQSMLLYGWLRHAWAVGEEGETPDPSARTISLVGLFALPVIHILLALGLAPDLAPRNLAGTAIWPVGILWILVAAIFVLTRRGRLLPAPVAAVLEAVFSLRWLYALIGRLFSAIAALFDFIGRLLEGQAGVLWALLMITLLLSLILQLALET